MLRLYIVGRHVIILWSTTLSAQDKQIVEDRLSMYDSLLDQDPEIQEHFARGVIQGQQKGIIAVIEVLFPSLVELAQQQVAHLNKSYELSRLMKQIALAPDEATARWLLSTLAA